MVFAKLDKLHSGTGTGIFDSCVIGGVGLILKGDGPFSGDSKHLASNRIRICLLGISYLDMQQKFAMSIVFKDYCRNNQKVSIGRP